MAYTNADIVPAALEGKTAHTPTGNFSTGRNVQWGILPRKLVEIFSRRTNRYEPVGRRIGQIIYSFSTPIAWQELDARGVGEHVWVIPDVRYSVTTSGKHQSQLWKLPNTISIPWDCGRTEYLELLEGYIQYSHGVMSKGPVARP